MLTTHFPVIQENESQDHTLVYATTVSDYLVTLRNDGEINLRTSAGALHSTFKPEFIPDQIIAISHTSLALGYANGSIDIWNIENEPTLTKTLTPNCETCNAIKCTHSSSFALFSLFVTDKYLISLGSVKEYSEDKKEVKETQAETKSIDYYFKIPVMRFYNKLNDFELEKETSEMPLPTKYFPRLILNGKTIHQTFVSASFSQFIFYETDMSNTYCILDCNKLDEITPQLIRLPSTISRASVYAENKLLLFLCPEYINEFSGQKYHDHVRNAQGGIYHLSLKTKRLDPIPLPYGTMIERSDDFSFLLALKNSRDYIFYKKTIKADYNYQIGDYSYKIQFFISNLYDNYIKENIITEKFNQENDDQMTYRNCLQLSSGEILYVTNRTYSLINAPEYEKRLTNDTSRLLNFKDFLKTTFPHNFPTVLINLIYEYYEIEPHYFESNVDRNIANLFNIILNTLIINENKKSTAAILNSLKKEPQELIKSLADPEKLGLDNKKTTLIKNAWRLTENFYNSPSPLTDRKLFTKLYTNVFDSTSCARSCLSGNTFFLSSSLKKHLATREDASFTEAEIQKGLQNPKSLGARIHASLHKEQKLIQESADTRTLNNKI